MFDSFLQVNLASGNYILGVGSFFMEESEFRSGIASTPGTRGDYQLTYDGVTLRSIPEPATIGLLGLALVAGASFRRRC